METILITSALLYANGPLHFGHIAGAYLPGDCYARFQRLMGNDVLYICGSDEYGVAITLSAELAKRSPKEHVDHFHEINRSLFKKLHFSFDHYSRTTWPGHIAVVQDFFHTLKKRGLIEEKIENHLYSEEEKRFLADRYVIGTCPKCGFKEARGDECQQCASTFEAVELKAPRSKLSGSPLVLKPSSHLYFLFDRFKTPLKAWIKSKEWKENVIHFSMRYIEDLKTRAITRDSTWGVPVPNHPDKVFYVWFDAPIGYISATQEWAQKIGKPDQWKHYWLQPKTKFVQFIGKDNIPFHTVFFPAMLMGQELPFKLPDAVPANEFLMLEGKQFSKSEGWYVDLADFLTQYTADQIRYALAANAPESADSEFSWRDFQKRCNGELLGKLGNFINRVLVFANAHCNARVPSFKEVDEEDRRFLNQIDFFMKAIADRYATFHLRKITQLLMDLAQLGNTYFDAKKPWVAVKEPALRSSLETTIAACITCIQNLALAASPIIPETAQKIWQMLGHDSELAQQSWQKVRNAEHLADRLLPEPTILFRKVEDTEIEIQIAKLGKKEEAAKSPSVLQTIVPIKDSVSFGAVEKLDLRIAQILEAVKIPKSKKLLKLFLDVGFEKRTVVSGIALSYAPEQLVGKKVILVANLAPATIMGIESQGMILAASFDSNLELPLVQNLPPGSSVS